MSDLIAGFQDLVAQVPELVQPLIIALAGAVPFIEGEGAASIGIIGGINPVVAAIAGFAGNFICVAIVVLIGARVRSAVVARTSRGRGEAPSPRREKVMRAYERYGTPGVSLLGPLLVPTQITAAALVGTGVAPGKVLFWQGVAIALWTTLLTLIITGVISLVG